MEQRPPRHKQLINIYIIEENEEYIKLIDTFLGRINSSNLSSVN